jgi:iron complex outermembrane recepter protein
MLRYVCAPLILTVGLVAPAQAAENIAFSIPAMPLDQALVRLGEQARVSIGGTALQMRSVMAHPVQGRMSLSAALRKMLQGTGFTYVMVDARTIRIVPESLPRPRVRKPPPSPKAKPKPAPPPIQRAAPEPPEVPPVEIIVTASKQSQPLSRYPGTAHVELVGGPGLTAERGTAALVGRLPELSATNLGPGRNKLFIRGVADSSFSGPTQSTVGMYLGDLRLTYNAPEPDLRYYDIDRIEVVEGPQGTLYGAGSLGGIVRIMPQRPNLGAFGAETILGYSVGTGGADGYDLGGMVNVPIIADRVGLRVVGYKQVEGGYIDNLTLAQPDTNKTKIEGARLTLEINPGDNWRISAMGVLQNIDTRDGQYAQNGLARLSRTASIAQPADNDFRGVNLVISKSWDNVELVSSFGIVDHRLDERFDPSSQIAAGTAYDRAEHIHLITQETRLSSKSASRVSWVGGFSYVISIDTVEQFLGALPAPPMISAVRSEKNEIAVFGEASFPISERLSLTGGARVVRAKSDGQVVGATAEPTRKQWRLLPTAAISWRFHDRLQAYARLQTGFRSGGLSVDPLGMITRFKSDKIYTAEAGIRLGGVASQEGLKLSGSAAIFQTFWRDIQADLLDTNGLPTTLNIGSGHISGLQGNVGWRPNSNFLLEGAMFVNTSGLDTPASEFAGLEPASLPNVPHYGGRLSVRWRQPLGDKLTLQTDGIMRYHSASKLGTLPPLLLEQGEYFETEMGTSLIWGQWKLGVSVSNLFNSVENSFSFGNPFTVALGNEITPLRPRTFRLSIGTGF